jgi:hypothetical protein
MLQHRSISHGGLLNSAEQSNVFTSAELFARNSLNLSVLLMQNRT